MALKSKSGKASGKSLNQQADNVGALFDQTLIVLDTETTGLDYKTEQLLEVAAVKMEGSEVVDSFTALVKPSVPIRHSSYQIHGISEEMVADAPPIEEVLPGFLEFVGDLPYVAHNAIFDRSFINEACKRHLGRRFDNHRIDTLEIYRSVFPEEPSHGLSSMLARFGQDSHVEHRALDDARALASVFPQLRELYKQRMSWQFSQLENVPYLFERYLRLQKSVQMVQSEMADLKEIFKLHFLEGGKPVTATTGDVIVPTYRRSYEYNDARIWEILLSGGLVQRGAKLNPRFIDKLIDSTSLDDDIREQLREARTFLNENRTVTFLKPQAPTEEAAATDSPEDSEAG